MKVDLKADRTEKIRDDETVEMLDDLMAEMLVAAEVDEMVELMVTM